ncbi:hypothetical protein JL720_3299 [Aureococcus anophagefferens]|nr:hypothetical protein JL720_3299 [Aureococcus anophagefferens]
MADAEAKERLLGLLGYVKDMSAPSESEPCKDLASAPIVVHEALLRDVAGAGAVEFEGPCGAWLRVRRPEATGASRQSAAGKRGGARSLSRALRRSAGGAPRGPRRGAHAGRGPAALAGGGRRAPARARAGVPRARGGGASSCGAAGVGAALWPMPGVAGAGQIVPELETCGRDYGLLGRRREAPSPFDRGVAALLHRAAHLWAPTASWSTGRTRRPCPRSPPQRRRRTGRRCTTAPCSSAASRARTRAARGGALAALRRRTAPLPAALRRLAGDFSAPPAPAPAGVAGLWRAAAKWWRGPAAAPRPSTGLPSNGAQASVVATLEAKGCAVLVGPPGTGKSQTIANVICHYLALGRGVLVTSKGEPATEVLRKKLPDGIRELCVSLGSGDGGSFRRLEAAVEYLADTVAAAPDCAGNNQWNAPSRKSFKPLYLGQIEVVSADFWTDCFLSAPGASSSGRGPRAQRHDAARAELDAFDAEDAARALPAAPTWRRTSAATRTTSGSSASARLARHAAGRRARRRGALPRGRRRRPAAAAAGPAALDELRELRAAAAAALRWEPQLTSRAARARLAERLDVGAARDAAQRLRERNDVAALVRRGDLPRVVARRKPRRWPTRAAARSKSRRSRPRRPAVAAPAPAPRRRRPRGGGRLRGGLARGPARGARARAAETEVPPVLLRMVSAAKLDAPLAAPADDDDDAAVAAAVVGANDFFEEVRWRALRPDRRPFLAGLVRARPTATLAAELDEITVFGRRPKTPNEWELVLARLVLRGCAERFREALARLDGYARRGEGAPPTPGAAVPAPADGGDDAVLARGDLAKPLRELAGLRRRRRPVERSAARLRGALRGGPGRRGGAGAAALDGELRLLRRAAPATSATRDAAELQAALWRSSARRRGPATTTRRPSTPCETRRRRSAVWRRPSAAASGGRRAALREARAALGDVDKLRALARAKLARIAPAWAKRVVDHRLGPDVDAVAPRARVSWAAAAVRKALARRRVRSLVAAVARHALRGAMAPETCAALVRLVSAVAAAGATAGGSKESVRAARHREDLASAMADCSDAVPCWIMPTYRVSSCLPATLASFDLVVLDEASQSDVAALPALLRRACSSSATRSRCRRRRLCSEAAVRDLKRSLLASGHPFVEQVLPGRSVFDLAQTCFADARCALSHHFRCVPQCIAFSNAQFYHDRLMPRRLPPRSQRLTPALVDVKVPGGKKKGKTNEAEAAAVVAYLAAQLAPGGELAKRGASLARHDVVVGDPASLQGDERDVVLLSLVASPKEAPAQHRGVDGRPRGRPRRGPAHLRLRRRRGSLDDHLAAVKEQRVLERSNWVFVRLWTATWVLDREACERKLALACNDAGVRPRGAAAPARAAAAAAGRAARARADGRRRRRRDPRRAAAPRAAPPKRKPAKPAATQGPKAKKPKSAPKAAAAKPKKAAKKRRASDDDSDGEWDGD